MKKYDSQGKVTQTKTGLKSRLETESRTGDTNLSTLTPEEEKAIRMRYGLSEDDSRVLEFAVGASQDAKMRLVLMEACNIADLDGEVPLAAACSTEDPRVKDVIDRFSGRES
ncbi:MAG: hypothetical protein AUK47_23970 [Deltaproteobacteria bacterium CG2_30_63_29]|nr:MAG: hypothetical protein AUK47_23970 [Deltaproteobacteria bacterium CG2_30_63_29]PIV99921.1 MAG: hypothetical protein COW42_09510 [Deltaproteobacteria bacterium CG17_big_fil_post_rev_8_21_14_2_50_63_7]PJB35904.1 MAG: hypothetical protein CO108_24555 [Deltaproteobacteria bacterium CG_4_9_14_3_um_filter_63_12]